MESSSETVLNEKSNLTLSKVTNKCVREVSETAIQKLSSSSSIESDELIKGHLSDDTIMQLPYGPIVESPRPPDNRNVVENTCLQNEFMAMAIKDEHGNEIGQLLQQNQQKQSVNLSTFFSTVDSDSTASTSLSKLSVAKSSSMMQQTSATSVVADIQETASSSSSMSSSAYSASQKNEILSSSTKSLSSIKSSQSIKKVVKSSLDMVEDQ